MIDSLEKLLLALREAPAEQDIYHNILKRINFGIEELKPYIHYSKNFYTRNLIERNSNYEIMTLCWEPEHYTPIHDHQGSDGWLHVIEGAVLEKIYDYKPSLGQDNKLILKKEIVSNKCELSHINDEHGFHSIHNIGETKAVTLHFYSPSIKQCLYICPNSYVTKTKILSYYSKFGHKCNERPSMG